MRGRTGADKDCGGCGEGTTVPGKPPPLLEHIWAGGRILPFPSHRVFLVKDAHAEITALFTAGIKVQNKSQRS